MEANEKTWDNIQLIQTLKEGGVVVMPTDTVYGIVASALNPTAVSRVYTIRKRDTDKPCIILIGSATDMQKFGVELTDIQREKVSKLWPTSSDVNISRGSGPVSIVFPCEDDNFAYLHRRTKSLAFRLPSSLGLQELLREVGPLIAPSANPEGLPVAKNVNTAREYFGDLVDLYVDGGEVVAAPSKVIRLSSLGIEEVLRD